MPDSVLLIEGQEYRKLGSTKRFPRQKSRTKSNMMIDRIVFISFKIFWKINNHQIPIVHGQNNNNRFRFVEFTCLSVSHSISQIGNF